MNAWYEISIEDEHILTVTTSIYVTYNIISDFWWYVDEYERRWGGNEANLTRDLKGEEKKWIQWFDLIEM